MYAGTMTIDQALEAMPDTNKANDPGENPDEWESIDPGFFWEELAVIEKESK